jgi:hypothetical protein
VVSRIFSAEWNYLFQEPEIQKNMPNQHGSNNNNKNNNNNIPLLYRSLSTQRSCYPKYIILINGGTPIPIKHHYLGNENCMALFLSGHALSITHG